MDIAIGTAQFGLPYGVANNDGQVGAESVADILALAGNKNIHTLDTAAAYGTSEEVLGKVGVGCFDVISKLPSRPNGCISLTEWVMKDFTASIERLKVKSLYGYMLHRPMDLLDGDGFLIYNKLIELKEKGLVKNIGISIYDERELELLSKHYSFDLIQFPMNIFDRRLSNSGWLSKLKDQGVELHARSSFLQGLLLMSPNERPLYFAKWERLLQEFDEWLIQSNLTALQGCIGFLKGVPEVDKVVVGVNSVDHLLQIIDATSADHVEVPESIQSSDVNLINPGFWKL